MSVYECEWTTSGVRWPTSDTGQPEGTSARSSSTVLLRFWKLDLTLRAAEIASHLIAIPIREGRRFF